MEFPNVQGTYTWAKYLGNVPALIRYLVPKKKKKRSLTCSGSTQIKLEIKFLPTRFGHVSGTALIKGFSVFPDFDHACSGVNRYLLKIRKPNYNTVGIISCSRQKNDAQKKEKRWSKVFQGRWHQRVVVAGEWDAFKYTQTHLCELH